MRILIRFWTCFLSFPENLFSAQAITSEVLVVVNLCAKKRKGLNCTLIINIHCLHIWMGSAHKQGERFFCFHFQMLHRAGLDVLPESIASLGLICRRVLKPFHIALLRLLRQRQNTRSWKQFLSLSSLQASMLHPCPLTVVQALVKCCSMLRWTKLTQYFSRGPDGRQLGCLPWRQVNDSGILKCSPLLRLASLNSFL